jgi:3-hydroxyacyl-[acyl-carrier-protein] dehydratase
MGAKLDPAHPIFKGHFPDNPIVPGVCQVQMITESLQSVTGKKIYLKEADNIKFLSMINPVETETLIIDLALKLLPDHMFSVQATLSAKDQVYFKFKGIFA